MSKKNTRPLLPGIMYFYIHFVVEVLSFFFLYSIVGDSLILWLAPFIYDILAFIPQILIGALSDRFAKIPFGLIGILLMTIGLCLFGVNSTLPILIIVAIIALGNACVHVNGAEVTLRGSEGKIFPAALFVSGGAFGVITGKLLVGVVQPWSLIIFAITVIPVIIFAEKYREQTAGQKNPCKGFNYANKSLATWAIAILALFVVAIRGYIGYGIPTSWNKSTIQTVMLFTFMGIGKALGGVLVDKIGVRKTAYLSMLGAIPFLVFGDQNMAISLIGVMFFSMTMAITLAILVSVFPEAPGFAFGITTVGLAIGTLPVFFIKLNSIIINIIMIIVASIICLLIILKITRKEKKHA
jgi:hypothetical protein